jgi:proline iminopeptidase
MVDRYPAVEPYDSGMLAVTDGHRLYWEMCGAPTEPQRSSSTVAPEVGALPKRAAISIPLKG